MENLTENNNGKNNRKIDIAGLKVDAITKVELLKQIAERIARREKTFVATPYSEFLYGSLRNKHTQRILNAAHFSIADGIGVLWAHLFLSVPLTWPGFYLKILQAWCQVVWTGASILLRPSLLYRDIPEKIVGADFAWDLAALAEKHSFSIYLLGGFGDTTKIVAEKFLTKFPNLKIVGTSNKEWNDPSIIDDVTQAKPDIILVALGKLVQEEWIVDNLPNLPATFAIGLGGTLDYIAGARRKPPQFIRRSGLEWLYRLITQPTRVRRIYEATWGLILSLMRYKIHSAFPFRMNACAVVVNTDGKILLCKRTPGPAKNGVNSDVILSDYWQFPQGGIDDGEDLISGAARELAEETNITSVEVLKEVDYLNRYEWSNGIRNIFLPKSYRYRGQEQRTVIFKFTGDDSEIKLDDDELIEYLWLSPKEALEKIALERREHAAAVLAELAEIQVK